MKFPDSREERIWWALVAVASVALVAVIVLALTTEPVAVSRR